jgi:hypothetical protein
LWRKAADYPLGQGRQVHRLPVDLSPRTRRRGHQVADLFERVLGRLPNELHLSAAAVGKGLGFEQDFRKGSHAEEGILEVVRRDPKQA